MNVMKKSENIIKQYKNDDNLSARINFHAKHSTNKQGFIPWLFEKYEFSPNTRILELGCGNGEQWQGRIEQLPNGCNLYLSDYSDGMVEIVWNKYLNINNFIAQRVDIQTIPFPDNCFDVVIANHMLYHIPDLSKAISEVKRVLKPKAKFYASTNGNGGIRSFIHNSLKEIHPETNAFTEGYSFNLQNGKGILEGFFEDVQRYDFEDSLSITDTQDLIDWIKSTKSIADFSENDIDGLYDYFEEIRRKEGTINIPKEVGLFVSTNI